MLKLFKKMFFSMNKHKNFFSLIVLSLLLLLTPVQHVHADFWSDLGNFFVNLVQLPITVAVAVGIVGTMIPLLMTGIMVFVIYVMVFFICRAMILFSISIPISPSSLNAEETITVIYNSWNFVLGFVNMFFVLTLTFIGLAVILRLKDYEAKKLLTKILLIAILVNFTPVIIGFIVDMGNLATNFFISVSITGDPTSDFATMFANVLNLDAIGNFFGNLLASLFGGVMPLIGKALTLLGGMIIGIIFLGYSIYIYACVTGMFLLRVVMLWVLTILSPIAFFSYIFPESSPFQRLFPDILGWKKWWEEFLKWVIVGIPFSLFFYISNAIFMGGGGSAINSSSFSGISISDSVTSGIGVQVNDILASIITFFTYLVSVMMLHLGYKISKAAAPQMAQQMIKSTETLIKKAATTVATMGVGAVAGAAAGSMGSMASGLGGFSAKAASGGLGKRILGKGAGGLSKVMRRGQTRFTQVAIKNKPKIIDGFGDMNTRDQSNAIEGMVSKRAKAEHYGKMDLSKLSKEDKDKMIPIIEGMMENKSLRNEYGDTLRKMSKGVNTSEKIKVGLSDNPEEAKEAIDNKAEEIKENMNKDDKLKAEIEIEIIAKYGTNASEENKEQFMRDLAAKTLNFEELKPGDLKDLGKDNITSLAARLGSHKLSGNSLKNIRNNYGDATANDLFTEAGGIGNADLETLYQENPDLVRHLTTTEYGKTWEWKAALQLDEKYKHKKGDKEEGNADWKKIKAHMTTISPKKSREVIGVDSEITELAKRIKEQRIQGHDDNNYKFNSSFVDGLLKNAGITPGSTESSNFMDKWDEAQAGKEFIEARKKLQKKVDSILKESDNKIKEIEGLSKKKKEKKLPQLTTTTTKRKEIEKNVKKFNRIENSIKNMQEKLKISEDAALKAVLSNSVTLYKKQKAKLLKNIMGLDGYLTEINSETTP